MFTTSPSTFCEFSFRQNTFLLAHTRLIGVLEVTIMGHNQDPFTTKKRNANGQYDKEPHSIDSHGNFVPNTPTNDAVLRAERPKKK